MKICPGDWKNNSKMMNMKMDEENGKAAGMANGWYQKIHRFSRNEFWNNIGCLVSYTTFGIWGSSMW